MIAKTTYSLLPLAVLLFAAWMVVPATRQGLVAGSGSALDDSDEDFLPDSVEWAVLTSAANPDTDGDLVPDFVEVVQRGLPREAGTPLPMDHECRIVVTGPGPGNTSEPTWLHLLLRFVSPTPTLSALAVWVELPQYPGLRFPLSILSATELELRQRQTANDGLWVHVAVPMVSEQILQQILPCSIRAEADFGGRVVATGVKLFDVQGQTVSLVPFGQGSFALQSIGAQPMNSSLYSNKVCVLDLREAGSGPGGLVYEVVAADCEDCNELECSPSCPSSVGWLITLPGGLQGMFGH